MDPMSDVPKWRNSIACDFNAPDRCILSGIDSDDVFGKTDAKDLHVG